MKQFFILFFTFLACGKMNAQPHLLSKTTAGAASIEIYPGSVISDNLLYFVSSNDNALWRSDGTEEGTRMIKKIDKGPLGEYYIHNLQSIGDRVYFQTLNDVWVTDGTAEGTVLMGHKSISRSKLTGAEGNAFFIDQDEKRAVFMIRSDGSADKIEMIEGFYPDSSSLLAAYDLFYHQSRFYFSSSNIHTLEDPWYWSTDLTPEGTRKFFKGSGPISNIVASGDNVVFINYTTPVTVDIVKSDGTKEGTQILRSIDGSRNNVQTYAADGKVIIISKSNIPPSEDGKYQYDCWLTDATADGTKWIGSIHGSAAPITYLSKDRLYIWTGERNDQLMVADPLSGSLTSVRKTPFAIRQVKASEGHLLWVEEDTLESYIYQFDEDSSFVLHKVDGKYGQLITGPGKFYFGYGTTNNSWDLGVSDYTAEGTKTIASFNGKSSAEADATLEYAFILSDRLLFTADDGIYGRQWWVDEDNVTKILSDRLMDGKIIIYPTTADERIFLAAGNTEVTRLRLTDVSGRLVLDAEHPGPSVEVKQLNPGWYTAEITIGTGFIHQKILVVR